MAVDERARLELLRRLEEVLGGDRAMTLMEHLSPAGWADVARRSDIDALGWRLGGRMDAFEHRMDAFEHRMDAFDRRMGRFEERMDGFHHELVAQTRTFVFSMIGALATIASIAFAAARLI
ncbi:hypothetical protein BH20ACT9_BH20ACT9_01600 [soil metagenome]